MARRVFFSFHYTRDSHRVAQIRNCNAVSLHFERAPFLDGAEWESIKRKGDRAIQNWIDTNMFGCSVVAVLSGHETSTRPWVIYELEKAHRDGKGIICIDMSGMKNLLSQVDSRGINPLLVAKDSQGTPLYYYDKYKTHSWISEDGRNNIDKWIDAAALLANR